MAQALPSAARSSRSSRTSSRPTGPSSSLPRYAATWAARSALASKIAARGEMAEWSNAADSKSVVPIGYRGFESLSLRHFFSPLHRLRRVRSPDGPVFAAALFDLEAQHGLRIGAVHALRALLG